jgi:hypothetical protein
MKTFNIVATLLPILLLTGCVGVIPLPPASHRVYGQVIKKSQTRFIVVGNTTRGEVVARLGGQFRDSPRLPVLAYSWEKPAADMAWWFIIPLTEAGVGGNFERSHWRAFFLAFDAGGKVCRTEFVSLSGNESLDEQLEDWALRKHKSFWETDEGFFDSATGRPWFLEKVEEAFIDKRKESATFGK